MTMVGAGRAIARPARWLARNIAHALTAIGLSMHGRPYRHVDAGPVFFDPEPERESGRESGPGPGPDPVKARVPVPPAAEAARTGFRDDLPSLARLTPDELLWQAELDQWS